MRKKQQLVVKVVDWSRLLALGRESADLSHHRRVNLRGVLRCRFVPCLTKTAITCQDSWCECGWVVKVAGFGPRKCGSIPPSACKLTRCALVLICIMRNKNSKYPVPALLTPYTGLLQRRKIELYRTTIAPPRGEKTGVASSSSTLRAASCSYEDLKQIPQ